MVKKNKVFVITDYDNQEVIAVCKKISIKDREYIQSGDFFAIEEIELQDDISDLVGEMRVVFDGNKN